MNRKQFKTKCVFPVKRNGKPYRYMSRVIIKGKKFYLGCYKTENEASSAYDSFMNYLNNNPMMLGDLA